MVTSLPLVILVVAVALLFEFANGWNDSANAVATVISTRVLSPLQAIFLASSLNFVGAFLSTRVAKTIGGKLVDPDFVTGPVLMAAMLAAAIWVIGLTMLGLPISGSHSLIGGLVGAAAAYKGVAILQFEGINVVLLALFVSPMIGLVAGFMLMLGLIWIFRRIPQARVNFIFGKIQILSVSMMSLSHGTNDAQKVMGIITLTLFSGGYLKALDVPLWVVVVCALTMGIGTAAGGRKVIRTLGVNLMKLQPVHGFAAETSASVVLMGCAAFGIPVSTTHVITSTIMGVGATRRLSAVRWGLGRKIVYAWVFTLPGCAAFAACLYYLFALFV